MQEVHIYTLVLLETASVPDQSNNLDQEEYADFDVFTAEQEEGNVEHISFEMIRESKEEAEQVQIIETVISEQQLFPEISMISYGSGHPLSIRKMFLHSEQFLYHYPFGHLWMGEGASLIPP